MSKIRPLLLSLSLNSILKLFFHIALKHTRLNGGGLSQYPRKNRRVLLEDIDHYKDLKCRAGYLVCRMHINNYKSLN